MKKYRFILTVILFSLPTHASDRPWHVWKKNDLQSVSYREYNNIHQPKTSLIEIRAIVKVDSSISAFLSFIQDVNNTPRWLENTKESKIITQYSDKKNSFYISLLSTWPLKPRVLILESTYWQNQDLSVQIQVEDKKIDHEKMSPILRELELDQFYRIKTYSANWKITPVQNPKKTGENISSVHTNSLLIEYIVTADGKGDLPQWLADHFTLKSIWKSMTKMRLQLPNEIWQTSVVNGVKDLPQQTK